MFYTFFSTLIMDLDALPAFYYSDLIRTYCLRARIPHLRAPFTTPFGMSTLATLHAVAAHRTLHPIKHAHYTPAHHLPH